MNSTEAKEVQFESLSASQRERAIHAKRTYCSACEEHGVKACSWESFSGYQAYVDGGINEPELARRAQEEIRDLTHTFGKYTVVEREESAASTDQAEKTKRAVAANRIYRKVCSESGMDQCFFNNFAAWSDYVQGEIDDVEFSRKARLEVEKLKESASRN